MKPRIEMVARMISEQDRIEADEAPDFADWHWEERADLAKSIISTLADELAADGHVAAATLLLGQQAP